MATTTTEKLGLKKTTQDQVLGDWHQADTDNADTIDAWAGGVDNELERIDNKAVDVDPFAVNARNVTNLSFNDSNNRLSWSAPSTTGQKGAVTFSYKVYRNGSLVATTSNTYYDFGTIPGGVHSFKVEAVWDVTFTPRTVATATGETISNANTEKLATPAVSLNIASGVGTLNIGSVANATKYSIVVKRSGTQLHAEEFTTAGAKTITYTFALGYTYTVEVTAIGSTYYQNSNIATATKNYVQQTLGAPTIAGLTIDSTSIALTIGAVTGATGYEVRVLNSGNAEIVAETYGTAGAKTISGTFAEGESFTLQLWAVSANDDYTDISTIVTRSISVGYEETGAAPIYGVSGMYNSAVALTRTDDAVGLGFSINSSNGIIASDFNDKFPWNETTIEVINGNKFLKFPDMWFRVGKDASKRITDVAVSKLQGATGDWYKVDSFYYGCYGASESGDALKSVTGVARKHTATRAQFRTYATANGSGFFQLDLYHRTVVLFLWFIEFATKNSESVMVGKTSATGSSPCNCGGTDSVTTPSGFNTTTKQMRYHYIEDFIGNYLEFVDGSVGNGSKGGAQYVTADPSKFGDSSANHTALSFNAPNTSGNCLAALGWDTNNPFLCLPIETVNNGSYNTYFCDYGSTSNNVVLCVGASWSSSGASYGVSHFYRDGASASYGNVGGRLLYKP